MTQPLFSIVIPTFNRSNLFPYAVRSLLKQTFDDFEVIVSDNCSTDDTPQVAKQFTDPRVKYVRTPKHVVIADSWEFARRQATGRLIIALSDDDVFVSTALERFAQEYARHGADFIFCTVATYRDLGYPGSDKNSLDCPAFSGSSRIVSAEEFVRPLYQFRPQFNMHPSAYAFSKSIADFVEARTGRFFWTNGVEFSGWPMAALLARKIVHIDLPLNILGRTAKSWGSNTQLCNPGKERIDAFIKDVDRQWKHAPLNNFTTANLMVEGLLTAKSLFPNEFAAYQFDEKQYLRMTMKILVDRRSVGVDVSREMDEAVRYAAKYPGLVEELTHMQVAQPPKTKVLMQQLRSTVGNLGVRTLRRRVNARQLAQKLERGALRSGFWAAGDDFGFNDILGCAEFLGTQVVTPRSAGRVHESGAGDSVAQELR
jgi:glycosyltransferase involved in cell wall biosynthesis